MDAVAVIEDQRACADADPEIFFEAPAAEQRLAIRLYCNECPVIEACRDGADARQENWGVWGGETERQRHKRWKRDAL